MFQKCWTCALELFRETSVCLWECVCRCERLTHAVSASAFVLGLCFVSKIHWQRGQMSLIVVTPSLDNWTRSVCLFVCSSLVGLRASDQQLNHVTTKQQQKKFVEVFLDSRQINFLVHLFIFLISISHQKLIFHLLSKNPSSRKHTSFQLTVIQEKQKRCHKSSTEPFVQYYFGLFFFLFLYFPLFWVLPLTQIWCVQLTP